MKFLFSLISLFLIPGSAIGLYAALVAVFSNHELWIPITIGFGSGLVVSVLIIRHFRWFTTFEHEFTHALAALLFFRKISRFIVTAKKGGCVEYSGGFGGKFGNLIITMAPYFLPTFSVIAVLFIPLVPPASIFYYLVFTGFTLAFHIMNSLSGTYANWSKQQVTNVRGETSVTDIGRIGYIAAFLSITGLTLFSYGIALSMIHSGYPGIWPFLKTVCLSSWDIYYDLIARLISVTLR